MSHNTLLKCTILGDTSVGKSCLLLRYTDNQFVHTHDATVGIEFGIKHLQIDDQIIKLQIWDTAGQESFLSIVRSYYRASAIIVLVYDITQRSTYQRIPFWLDEIKKSIDDSVPFPVIILVGNKCEEKYRRQVSLEEANIFANNNNILFMEASAKNEELAFNVKKLIGYIYHRTDLSKQLLNSF